jgi:hypothetical protein
VNVAYTAAKVGQPDLADERRKPEVCVAPELRAGASPHPRRSPGQKTGAAAKLGHIEARLHAEVGAIERSEIEEPRPIED